MDDVADLRADDVEPRGQSGRSGGDGILALRKVGGIERLDAVAMDVIQTDGCVGGILADGEGQVGAVEFNSVMRPGGTDDAIGPGDGQGESTRSAGGTGNRGVTEKGH